MLVLFDDSNSLLFWQGKQLKDKNSEYIVVHNFNLEDLEINSETFDIKYCSSVFKELYRFSVSDVFEAIIKYERKIDNSILNAWLSSLPFIPEQLRNFNVLYSQLRRFVIEMTKEI